MAGGGVAPLCNLQVGAKVAPAPTRQTENEEHGHDDGWQDIRLSTHMPGQPLEGPVLDLIPQVRNAVTASSKFQFSTDSPPLHDGYGLEGLRSPHVFCDMCPNS